MEKGGYTAYVPSLPGCISEGDTKAEALSTRFASQWFRLQDLDKINPDALLFPYYDYGLAQALKQETELGIIESPIPEKRITIGGGA